MNYDGQRKPPQTYISYRLINTAAAIIAVGREGISQQQVRGIGRTVVHRCSIFLRMAYHNQTYLIPQSSAPTDGLFPVTLPQSSSRKSDQEWVTGCLLNFGCKVGYLFSLRHAYTTTTTKRSAVMDIIWREKDDSHSRAQSGIASSGCMPE